MIFVDEARIFVQAGDGGQGCESFYRDKYMRYPRPDGGDGGKGGDVVVQATRSIQTLLDFKFGSKSPFPTNILASGGIPIDFSII